MRKPFFFLIALGSCCAGADTAMPDTVPRAAIDSVTRIRLACGSGTERNEATIEHRSSVAGSEVQTELRYRLPNVNAVQPGVRWAMDIVPSQAPPMLRSLKPGASASEQPLVALALMLSAGALRPGGKVSGQTEYRLAEFPPGVSVVIPFADVAVEASGCA
ncbi:hypothetical protein [Roseateles violae]|uniref:Uncharacterized protein n=1 Tax=Roseateles violae TaxID=3058042 RepID=A0ABT8DQ17_9BURK|nr:hypothetical protein [Pelomonas sp. PFR6]MDN3920108.1 hypothetical protein [Pelomonas sp. PFR6]